MKHETTRLDVLDEQVPIATSFVEHAKGTHFLELIRAA